MGFLKSKKPSVPTLAVTGLIVKTGQKSLHLTSAAKPELNPTSQVLSLDPLACSSWGLLYRQGEQKAALVG